MSQAVFITGVTGFIGGDGYYELEKAHPDWSYTALVRNSDRGAIVASKYPKIRLVYGSLTDVELLEKEAASANIVLHFADADSEPAATALVKGLASRGSPGYLIHVSGTGILMWPDLDSKTFGDYRAKMWDDVADISEIRLQIPDHAPHRTVDKIVLAAHGSHANVRTAIVCPPTIYGCGRGPANQKSMQVPGLCRAALKNGKAVKVQKGENHWNEVHVRDLSKLFLKLAEAAAAGGEGASWDEQGYYYAESGDFAWGDVSARVAKEAKALGLVETDEVVEVDFDTANKLDHMGGALWGCNSRCKATRARQVLGWKPAEPALVDTIKETLEIEAAALQK